MSKDGRDGHPRVPGTPARRMLRVRFTDEEWERLAARAKAAGFETVSDYVRWATLEADC